MYTIFDERRQKKLSDHTLAHEHNWSVGVDLQIEENKLSLIY